MTATPVRTLRRWSVALVLPVLVAGCVNLRGNLTIDRQARASGDLILELDKDFATLGGITSLDAFKSQMTSADDSSGFAPSQWTDTRWSETTEAYVLNGTFRNRTVDNPDGLSFRRVGDRIIATVRFAGDPDVAGEDGELFGDMNLGQMLLRLRFPGRVLSTSGPGISREGDRAVKIDTPLTTKTMEATWTVQSAIAPPVSRLPYIIGGAAAAALIGGVAAWLLLQRRRRRQAEAAAASPASWST
jgi:hypothetical protein